MVLSEKARGGLLDMGTLRQDSRTWNAEVHTTTAAQAKSRGIDLGRVLDPR